MNQFQLNAAQAWCNLRKRGARGQSAAQAQADPKRASHPPAGPWPVPLLALLVLLLALIVQTWGMRQQARSLAEQQRQLVHAAVHESHQRELRHAVELARATLDKLAQQGGDPALLQQQALTLLGALQMGQNGYFFVYDAQNRQLLQTQHMRLSGVDFCDPETPEGAQQAQQLIQTANQGGGFVQYDWQRPSSQHFNRKTAFILPLGHWDWKIGSGIYEDDLQEAISRINQNAQENLDEISKNSIFIGAFLILLFGSFSYGIHRHVFSRLNQTIQAMRGEIVQTEAQTRQHMARDLHDGVLQSMTSAKYLLESAQSKPSQPPDPALIRHAIAQLTQSLQDMRHLLHHPRPLALRLGLCHALTQLTHTAQALGMRVNLTLDAQADALPEATQTALYRMAQEALANAITHSGGTALTLALTLHAREVHLHIHDNGHGMHPAATAPAGHGMGMSNIRARAAQLGGHCIWHSTLQGTSLDIHLPRKAPA